MLGQEYGRANLLLLSTQIKRLLVSESTSGSLTSAHVRDMSSIIQLLNVEMKSLVDACAFGYKKLNIFVRACSSRIK